MARRTSRAKITINMIKLIYFDLDNCIFDTISIGENFLADVLAIGDRAVIEGEITKETNELLKIGLWYTSLIDIARQLKIPEDLINEMNQAHQDLVLPDKLVDFGDIDEIAKLIPHKILVTTGYAKFQQGKIDRLGLANTFERIVINDPSKQVVLGKTRIFRDIATELGLAPRECLVIGDNPNSELGSGKELGMITVQTLRPRVNKTEGFDHYIETFRELPDIIDRYK
jgi:FMN phosphatase YigB (HAD superfamily)